MSPRLHSWPLVVVVVSAVLIVAGRVGRITPVLIAGFALLVVAALLEFYRRSR